MFLIRGMCPRTDVTMDAHCFSIDLSAEWKDMVAASGLKQEDIDNLLKHEAEPWLDACGYGGMFDPDNCGFERDPKKKPGPDARRSYSYREVRVSWGEFGPQHISVPGNACGLDIDSGSFGSYFEGGRLLLPHNIDCWNQKNLLLIVFTTIAESVTLFARKD